MSNNTHVSPSFESAVILFACLLIFGDLAFLALHFLNMFVLEGGSIFFSIGQDRGVAEFFQYIKYIWLSLLILLIARKTEELSYLTWCPIFIYLLLDDAVKIHETFGGVLAGEIPLKSVWGLRLQDYGELAVSLVAGVVLLVPVAAALVKGSTKFRKTSADILLFIGALAFFGVFVDMVHIALPVDRAGKFVLGVVEDGGEMITISVLVGYLLLRTNSSDSRFLVDPIRVKPRGIGSGKFFLAFNKSRN